MATQSDPNVQSIYCIIFGSDPFYIVSYFIYWDTTSWTGGSKFLYKMAKCFLDKQ